MQDNHSGIRGVGLAAGSAYEPGPKVPAFSATSRADFRFCSNSSHLVQPKEPLRIEAETPGHLLLWVQRQIQRE